MMCVLASSHTLIHTTATRKITQTDKPNEEHTRRPYTIVYRPLYTFDGIRIYCGYFMDMLSENKIDFRRNKWMSEKIMIIFMNALLFIKLSNIHIQ